MLAFVVDFPDFATPFEVAFLLLINLNILCPGRNYLISPTFEVAIVYVLVVDIGPCFPTSGEDFI